MVKHASHKHFLKIMLSTVRCTATIPFDLSQCENIQKHPSLFFFFTDQTHRTKNEAHHKTLEIHFDIAKSPWQVKNIVSFFHGSTCNLK